MPKVILKKTTPSEIIKEVQKETNNKKEFDLFVFCKLYKHQIDTLPWKKVCNLFSFLEKKKININYLTFTLPEKEKLKGAAGMDNLIQSSNNPGLATMAKFLMEDKQISQLEERVLFWINKNHSVETIKNNAKEKIINGNKKILFYFVKKLHFKLEHDNGEMLTEGYMELRKMFEKFKPESNYKFLSYAQWSIYQVMKKCICQEQNYVHLPLNVLNQIYKLNKWIEEQGENLWRDRIKDYQLKNHISKKSMELMLRYRNGFGKVSSFDSLVEGKNNRETTFEQLLPEDQKVTVTVSTKTYDILEALKEVLTPLEYDVIKKYYGIGCETETKKQIIKENKSLNQAKLNTVLKTALNKLKKNKNKFSNLF